MFSSKVVDVSVETSCFSFVNAHVFYFFLLCRKKGKNMKLLLREESCGTRKVEN